LDVDPTCDTGTHASGVLLHTGNALSTPEACVPLTVSFTPGFSQVPVRRVVSRNRFKRFPSPINLDDLESAFNSSAHCDWRHARDSFLARHRLLTSR